MPIPKRQRFEPLMAPLPLRLGKAFRLIVYTGGFGGRLIAGRARPELWERACSRLSAWNVASKLAPTKSISWSVCGTDGPASNEREAA